MAIYSLKIRIYILNSTINFSIIQIKVYKENPLTLINTIDKKHNVIAINQTNFVSSTKNNQRNNIIYKAFSS